MKEKKNMKRETKKGKKKREGEREGGREGPGPELKLRLSLQVPVTRYFTQSLVKNNKWL